MFLGEDWILAYSSSHLAHEEQPVASQSFRCILCGSIYKRRSSLAQHMEVHSNKTKCPICEVTLSRRVDVRRHMKLVHKISFDALKSSNSAELQ